MAEKRGENSASSGGEEGNGGEKEELREKKEEQEKKRMKGWSKKEDKVVKEAASMKNYLEMGKIKSNEGAIAKDKELKRTPVKKITTKAIRKVMKQ